MLRQYICPFVLVQEPLSELICCRIRCQIQYEQHMGALFRLTSKAYVEFHSQAQKNVNLV